MNTLQNVGHQTLKDWFDSLLKHYAEGADYSSKHPKLSRESTALLGFFLPRIEQFIGKSFSVQLFGALLKLSADELLDDQRITELFPEKAKELIVSRNKLILNITQLQLHEAMIDEAALIGKVLFQLEGINNLHPSIQQIQKLPQFQKI